MSEQIFKIITTEENVFIHVDTTRWCTPKYLYDGEEGVKTEHPEWFQLKSRPTRIQKVVPRQRTRIWYELKEGHGATDEIPATHEGGEEYSNIIGLYDRKEDWAEETLEDVEFTLKEFLATSPAFRPVLPQHQLIHDMITQITLPNALRLERKCTLSVHDSYKIIEKHVKENYNSNFARIEFFESLYHFSVYRKIKLHKPREWTSKIGRRTVRKISLHREEKLFDIIGCSHQGKSYGNRAPIKPFEGDTYIDLLKNIDAYLIYLISKINVDVKECECCGGTGLITLNESEES